MLTTRPRARRSAGRAAALLRENITRGREAVVAILAEVVGPGLSPGRASPDPALTARLVSAVADEAARLVLTHPRRYPIDRLVDHARWLLEEVGS
jgi:hypothetical protein